MTLASTDPGDHWFPRVSLQVTTTEREDTTQDGPGGSVHAWRAFGPAGEVLWDLDEEGTATQYDYEPLTGERVAVTRNATQLSPMPSGITDGFGTGLPPMPGFTANGDGELSSLVVYDAAGRPVRTVSEAGVKREFEYRLGELPLSTRKWSGEAFVSYGWAFPVLMVVERPHDLGNGSFDAPIRVQWADADLNLLRASTYEPSATFGFDVDHGYPVASAIERSRTVHAYTRSGLLEQTVAYPMLERVGGLLNGLEEDDFALVQRFEYNSAGQLARQIDPEGLFVDTTYDAFGRPATTARGKLGGANAVESSWLYYDAVIDDQGAAATPDAEGKPSLVVTLVDDLAGVENDQFRSVRTVYDWRRRPRLTFTLDTNARPNESAMSAAAAGAYQVSVLDLLGRPTDTFTISGGDMSALITALKDDEFDVAWAYANLGTRISSHIRTFYSDRGLVHRVEEAIDPTGQASEAWLATRTWYDEVGRPLMSLGPNGPVTRTYFDRLGRAYRTDVRDGAAARNVSADFEDAVDGDDDIIFERVETHFDENTGLPWLVTTSRRAHDATGGGLGAAPVMTYVGTAYDAAARPIGTVDFGVNTDAGEIFASGGDTPTPAHVHDAVAGEASPLRRVTRTLYDTVGRADRVIDPEGVVSMTLVDDLGRVIGAVANAREFAVGNNPMRLAWTLNEDVGLAGGYWFPNGYPEAVDQDVLTTVVYDRGGREHLKMALVGQGDSTITWTRQFTEFVYDPDDRTTVASDPLLNWANLPGPLFEIRYPDASTGEPGVYSSIEDDPNDVVRHGYNFAGEQIATEDQNHNVRQFERDVAGRVLRDEVVAFGDLARRMAGEEDEADPVSQWAESITTEYDSFGRVTAVQTLDESDNTLNEVAYTYDARGRLIELAQETDGPVSEQSPVITLSYETAAHDASSNANRDRLASIKYPDGTEVLNDYGQGADDAISRLVALLLGEQDLVSYQHLGLGTVAITELGPIQSDRTVGDDGKRRFGTNESGPAGAYPGWDRFGRLRSLSWVDVEFSAHDTQAGLPDRPPLVQWRYTWSPAGDLLSKHDSRPGAQWSDRDRRHTYDDLHRLIGNDVGLYTNYGGDQFDHAPSRSEQWTLDSIGNWNVLAADDDGDGAFETGETEQTRGHNAANELITFDFDSDGQGEERRFYDDAGSLGLKRTHDGQAWSDGHRFLYDAWNRLVEVRGPESDGNGGTI